MSKLKNLGWWLLWFLLAVVAFISSPFYIRRRNVHQSKKEMNDTRAKINKQSANTEGHWLDAGKEIDKERNSN